MKLRVFNILKNTKVEGPGNRYCIWVQGCSLHCRGCQATHTWSHSGGINLNTGDIIEDILNQKDIEGVTFLGGEPFEQAEALGIIASRPWCGSSNQRYHFLTDRYNEEIFTKYTNKVEVNISQNGFIFMNGMGNFDEISKKLKFNYFTRQAE